VLSAASFTATLDLFCWDTATRGGLYKWTDECIRTWCAALAALQSDVDETCWLLHMGCNTTLTWRLMYSFTTTTTPI